MSCAFDPRRPCGSTSRSKLGYDRATLVRIAKGCGIHYANTLSVSTLCRLLRDVDLDNQKALNIRQQFLDLPHGALVPHPEAYIPLPKDMEKGTMSVSSALALLKDPEALGRYLELVRVWMLEGSTIELRSRSFVSMLSLAPMAVRAEYADHAQQMRELEAHVGPDMMEAALTFNDRVHLFDQRLAKESSAN
jgi:hypothetical protein